MKNRLKICLAVIVAAVTSLLSPISYTASATDLAKSEQKLYYKNAASVMTVAPENVTFATENAPELSEKNYSLDLDGVWRMTDKGKIADLSRGEGWDSAINATVPGSIYTALYEAGVIEDPYLSDNMKADNKYSERSWYFERKFTYNGSGKKR